MRDGDLNGKYERWNDRSQEVLQLVQSMVQQGKGDSARRSKEEAARQLRDISRQLRLKGELMPLGNLRKAAHRAQLAPGREMWEREQRRQLS